MWVVINIRYWLSWGLVPATLECRYVFPSQSDFFKLQLKCIYFLLQIVKPHILCFLQQLIRALIPCWLLIYIVPTSKCLSSLFNLTLQFRKFVLLQLDFRLQLLNLLILVLTWILAYFLKFTLLYSLITSYMLSVLCLLTNFTLKISLFRLLLIHFTTRLSYCLLNRCQSLCMILNYKLFLLTLPLLLHLRFDLVLLRLKNVPHLLILFFAFLLGLQLQVLQLMIKHFKLPVILSL